MSNENVIQKETVVGGWSPYGPLTPEENVIFKEAIAGIVGVDYTPTAVSTQVVAGMNYRYKCNASIPPSDVIWEAIVEIYKPLGDKKPIVIGITRI
ncbi:hypothetical protein JMN32_06775 [Fulvivirga sp. 29W222]|uniref:Uncharacterized protein n=1 Tax=Fulvivirga marina TaxID=2494733 RepID=A0A937FU04_9BACT|nr:hypothetical protein [Fulvivirga marina]MBL6446005.1 hypothetical protein [Fulvivirga marina]